MGKIKFGETLVQLMRNISILLLLYSEDFKLVSDLFYEFDMMTYYVMQSVIF